MAQGYVVRAVVSLDPGEIVAIYGYVADGNQPMRSTGVAGFTSTQDLADDAETTLNAWFPDNEHVE